MSCDWRGSVRANGGGWLQPRPGLPGHPMKQPGAIIGTRGRGSPLRTGLLLQAGLGAGAAGDVLPAR